MLSLQAFGQIGHSVVSSGKGICDDEEVDKATDDVYAFSNREEVLMEQDTGKSKNHHGGGFAFLRLVSHSRRMHMRSARLKQQRRGQSSECRMRRRMPEHPER